MFFTVRITLVTVLFNLNIKEVMYSLQYLLIEDVHGLKLLFQDALSLGKKRPVLHCTTLPVVVLLTCLTVGCIIDSPRVLRFGWLAWVALFSHHIRDSSRRGLWLWPLGSSPPLPYYIYLCVTLALPYLVIIPLSSRTASVSTTDYAQYTV